MSCLINSGSFIIIVLLIIKNINNCAIVDDLNEVIFMMM